MNIEDYQKHISRVKSFYLTQKGELERLKRVITDKEKDVARLEKETEGLTTGKKVIEEACKEAREQSRQLLESMATIAIDSVFKDETAVLLQLNETAQGASLDVKIVSRDENGQMQISNPSFDGGGLNDILSTAFLVSIGNTVPDNYAPLVLDEPSKFVSKGTLAENFAAYMKDLSIFSTKQMIISTHDEALLVMGDTKHNLVKVGNYTQVTREV